MSESFAELFEQSQIEGKMRPGSIVSATVVDISEDTVIVNAGLKSEGLIPASQFFDENGEIEVSVGDEVDVSLDAVEDGFGETPFEYRSPGEIHEEGYDLWSRGPDGLDDEGNEGSDDVKNWIEK